jgi:hypothetical protein
VPAGLEGNPAADSRAICRTVPARVTAMRLFANGEGTGVIRARTSATPASAARRLPRAALERLVGANAAGGMTLRVFLEGDALNGQVAGQPAVSLIATSATGFDVAETGALD